MVNSSLIMKPRRKRQRQKLGSSPIARSPRQRLAKQRQLHKAFSDLKSMLGSRKTEIHDEETLIKATIERIRELEQTLVTTIACGSATDSEKESILNDIRGSFKASSSHQVSSPSKSRRRLNFNDFPIDKTSVNSNNAQILKVEEFLKDVKKPGQSSIFEGFEAAFSDMAQI